MMSQTQYDTFDVVIDASPPYGFRLVQKLMDNSLVVSKIRQGGKAEQSGLREGDVLQAVNSRSCGGFNCTQALNLIDSASQPLVLAVKRKAGTHPRPTNQPVIVRQTDFLPKKKAPPTQPSVILPTIPVKPRPSPEHAPESIRTTTVPLVLGTPQQPEEANKPQVSEPKKVFVGSTYHEPAEEETPKKVAFGGASSSVVASPSNFNYFTDSAKKTYTDSAFFSDASGKYPTLEEQVQLARKVAMSVLAPINADSKGHKMFLKAKERAAKYTTGGGGSEEEEDSIGISDTLQNMPQKVAFAPKLPTDSANESMDAMSIEEIELMKLQGRKTTHTNVAPRVCFSLADDLKNMKGKGGQLFAKRQAKSEAWTVGGGEVKNGDQTTVEENPERKEREQKRVMDKLATKHQMEKALRGEDEDSVGNLGYGNVAVNKLDVAIKKNKSSLNPWEAAAEYGMVDKAFEHLEKIDSHLKLQLSDSQQRQQQTQTTRPTSLLVRESQSAVQQQPTTVEDFARIRATQARSPGYRPVKFNPGSSSIEPPPGIPISDA